MEISEEEVKQQIAQLDQRNKELAANSKYLQEDNDGLRDRIQQLEQASSQITQLDQQTEELAASSKYLQEDNDGLRDRIQQLEQALYQIGPLNEQVQDLTASSRDLKEENNSLNDRILQLEHESTCQDQEIRLLQKQLKERLPVQEMDLKTLNSVMRGMHVGRVAEHGQLGEEIQELKSQIQALIATRHTSGERDRDGKSREPAKCRSFSNI